MRLFGRRYRLQVDDFRFEGLDIRFEVEASTKPTPNNADITITNLTAAHRKQLQEVGDVYVRLEVGWADGIWEVFRGDLRHVTSRRVGSDWETSITAGDGEATINRSRLAMSFGPGMSLPKVLREIASAMGAVIESSTVGYIDRLAFEGSGAGDFGEGVAFSGPAPDVLDDLLLGTGLEWSIQAGELRVVPVGVAVPGSAVVLTGDHIVGSPEPGSKGITEAVCHMLPGVAAGRQIQLDTEQIKGVYRAERVRPRGDTKGSDWVQLLDLRPV